MTKIKGFSTGCPECHTGFGKHAPACPNNNTSKLHSQLINTDVMLAMQRIHEACVHHYTAFSPDCDHRHFTHPIRECPPYLDALEDLMNECFTQGAEYK